MKKFISFVKNSIFFSAICITVLLFASCENFLKAQDTAEQIKEAIEIANSNPTTIYIEAEKDSGTVTPSQVRVKKKETFDMKFSPADNWTFIGWGVYDRNTNEPVTDAIKFDDVTKLEVKATVLKAVDNLIIRPDCLKLPAIVSATPGDGQASYANTPIIITFNMPMEDQAVTAADSIFKYDSQNVYISLGSVDMTEYFEEPKFNAEKTTLTIMPKASALRSFITTLNKPFIDIQISFGSNIQVKNGENKLSLAHESQELVVRYKKDVEQTPPEKYEFYAAEGSDSSTHFTQAALSTFTNTQILQNRTDGTIYIHGSYYDADSGVSTVKLTEKHTNAKDGAIATVLQEAELFTAGNANFTDDGNGNTEFSFEYNLKSDDGAILISVIVYDASGNPSEEQTFTVIKDSGIDLSGVELWNFKYPFDSGGYFTYEGTGDGTTIEYDDWSSIVRNVKLNPIKKQVYKNCYVPETDLGEVSLTYNSITHKMSYDSNAEIWNYNIPNDIDISGLEMTLNIEDDFGHKVTKQFSFPDVPNLINIEQKNLTNYFGHSYNSYTAYFSTRLNVSRVVSVHDKRFSETTNGQTVDVSLLTQGSFSEYREYSPSTIGSLSIGMSDITPDAHISNGKYFYGISSNYRFFFMEEQLAGFMTEEIKVSDVKTVDNSLPKVVIKECTETLSDNNKFLNLHIVMDTTNYNPCETYNTIVMQFAQQTTNPSFTTFIDNNATSFIVSVPYTSKVYYNTNYIKLIGVTDTNISPDYSYSESDEDGWYQVERLFLNPQKYEKLPPVISNIESGIPSISAFYNTEGLNIPVRYDYMIPVLGYDKESGVKKIIVNANGNIWTYDENNWWYTGSNHIHYTAADGTEYDASSYHTLPPVWDVDKELNELTITYYDKYDNWSVWSGNYYSIKIPSFSLKDGTANTFESDETDETLYQWSLGIAKLDSSSNTWSKHTEITTTPIETTKTGGGKVYTYSGVSLPSNQFVKVVGTAALEEHPSTPKFGNSVPYYIYTGSTKNSHEYDYITSLGSSKKEVLVVSDAPTFVHTIVTKYPLSECQNWTVEQWEHNHKHIGDKYMTFPTENPTAKKYTIPVDSMDTGDCYVVIAHFADGTTAMSEVMQK